MTTSSSRSTFRSCARVGVGERMVELQSDLADRVSELEEASLAKDQILSTASHELKTPLTSIVGYIDRVLLDLERVGSLNERQQRYLETVQRNSHRLKVLIDDLLDTSRITSGSIELSLAELNIRQEIEDVVRSMQALIRRHANRCCTKHTL